MESFIETVKNNPCLWNPDDLNYKNADIKESVWGQVAEECGLPDNKEAKHIWKTLRDGHRQAVRRANEFTRDRRYSTKKARWQYEEQMSFILPHMRQHYNPYVTTPYTNKVHNIEIEEIPSGRRVDSESLDRQYKLESNGNLGDGLSQDDEQLLAEWCEREPVIDGSLSHSNDRDSLDLFFRSMCNSTKLLPGNLQRLIKRDLFNEVIECEEEFERLNSN